MVPSLTRVGMSLPVEAGLDSPDTTVSAVSSLGGVLVLSRLYNPVRLGLTESKVALSTMASF